MATIPSVTYDAVSNGHDLVSFVPSMMYAIEPSRSTAVEPIHLIPALTIFCTSDGSNGSTISKMLLPPLVEESVASARILEEMA